MSPAPQPPPSAESRPRRLPAVDALRALALLGILAVNIWFFADPVRLVGGEPTTAAPTVADQLVALVVTVVFEAKSYVLFSFLFGLSFVHQQAAAWRAGTSESGRTLRRMLVLAVLGVLHGILLFAGDILLAYAILGVLLLALRGLRTRTALVLAVVVAAGFSLVILGIGALAALLSGTPGFAEALPETPDAAAAVAAYTGPLPEYLAFQLARWAALAPSILFGQGIMAFAAFLVGLAAARAQVLERILDRSAARPIPTGLLVAILLPSLLVGLALSTTAAVLRHGLPGAPTTPQPAESLLASGLSLVAGPIQATGATILVLMVLRSRPGARLTAALAPAGRMTLTNYLGQSLVLALLFSGLGLGLAGEVSGVVVGSLIVLIVGRPAAGLGAVDAQLPHRPAGDPAACDHLCRSPDRRAVRRGNVSSSGMSLGVRGDVEAEEKITPRGEAGHLRAVIAWVSRSHGKGDP
nr:DUF418 domain-containing protein [Nesterenkonia sp. F]